MARLTCILALVLLGVSPASAQEPGVLAIDAEAGRYAFSFHGEGDALNMCGTTGCEVVATFSACLGLGYSSPTQGRNVWTWVEAATEGAARQAAFDECEQAGGPACEVLNVFCAEAPAIEAAAAPDAAQENLFWQSILDSTDPADFEAYLRQYPDGAFRVLARNRLARLGAAASGAPPDIRPEPAEFGGDPVCGEQPRGAPCWMEVANRPGCYVWNPNPQPEETVTWTGECNGGVAEGSGSLTWTFGGTVQVATGGRLRAGRMDGTWTVTEQGPDGREPRRFEATFADGAPAGQSAQAQEPQRPQRPQESSPPPEAPRPPVPPRPQRPPTAATGRACEIPGFPTPSDLTRVGLRWCESTVDFQTRVFALQAAGAWCAIAGGTSSSPAQIRARHQDINAACDTLEAFDAIAEGRGPSCRCPTGYRP